MAKLERILFLTENLENNGPAYNCLTLARALIEEGVSVRVSALASGSRESSFFASGINYNVDRYIGGILRGRNSREAVAEFKPDIIHALDINLTKLARKLSVKLGVPFVVTENRCTEKDTSKLLSDANIIAVSDAVQMALIKNGKINRNQIKVINNCVDLTRYKISSAYIEKMLHGGNESGKKTPVVGSLGSLLPAKGQRLLLKAAKIVLEKHKNIEFVIIGQGPDLNPLRKFASEYGISKRIIFTNGLDFTTSSNASVANKQEALFLKDFDIFVEPSSNEGLGLSVMQAMAWARPVVACGAGGLYSLVEDGVNGFLVQKENAEEMAEAISKLLSDRTLANKMGARGREIVESKFNSKIVVKQHIEYYQWLLAKAGL